MSDKRKLDEIVDESDDPVVSLQDIIAEDEELETTANAVLGGSDDKECTYPHGYVARQALYACETCSGSSGDAGVCLACSLECHDGHKLYELYTKRNFRCDCGNTKFPELTCSLCPEKNQINSKNSYNQNFKGTYCTCHRPYPDPDDSVDDEMIQCVACEDWFHSRHLKGDGAPPGSDYAEMICHLCMSGDAYILWPYHQDLTSKARVGAETASNTTSVKAEGKADGAEKSDAGKDHETRTAVEEEVNVEPESDAQEPSARIQLLAEVSCKLKLLQRTQKALPKEIATFWPDDWRARLCCCIDCSKTLEEKNMMYLLCHNDSVAEYEKQGTDSKCATPQIGVMDALGGMNRVQQVEMLHGYNDLKAKLSDYLKTFAEQGKVVTEGDIKAFFQRMTNEKRQKVVVPHFCK